MSALLLDMCAIKYKAKTTAAQIICAPSALINSHTKQTCVGTTNHHTAISPSNHKETFPSDGWTSLSLAKDTHSPRTWHFLLDLMERQLQPSLLTRLSFQGRRPYRVICELLQSPSMCALTTKLYNDVPVCLHPLAYFFSLTALITIYLIEIRLTKNCTQNL